VGGWIGQSEFVDLSFIFHTTLSSHGFASVGHRCVTNVWRRIHLVSRVFGLSDKVVCIHSLKHGATSALADAHMTDEEGRMAAGFKDATTLRIYDHPGIQLSDRLSHVLRIHGEEGEHDPIEDEAISTSTGCFPVV
jgi:hypothetical protein